MQFSRGRRRRAFYYKRRRKNLIPILTFLVLFGLLLWAGKVMVSVLFSDVRTEKASSIIHILEGGAEFSLAQTDTWTTAFSEQKFYTGDSVRTRSNARISLEMLGGNILFLGPNTEMKFEELEEKSSGKKLVHIKLNSGRVWARVSDDDFNEENDSKFQIETGRLNLFVRGTVFDIQTTEVQDVVRLIDGNIQTEVFDGENGYTLSLGVGQKLVINEENLAKLRNDQDILEGNDTEFQESEWHLKNLERFFPQKAAEIRRRIEISSARAASPFSEEKPALETSQEVESAKILSPKQNAVIPASKDTVTIEGTAPENAMQVVVTHIQGDYNSGGYTLNKFNPGDQKWTYFAAQKYGTLLAGENIYRVEIISKDGKKSPPAELKITYEGESETPVEETTEATETPPETTLDDFAKPVITYPPIADPDEPYETSADKVTIRGLVDPKTNAVEVNDYRLKKFEPGNTEFAYTAIATVNNANMQEGENIYKITAFGPDGKQATTTIKIFYTPVKLPSSEESEPAQPLPATEIEEAGKPPERFLDLDLSEGR